MKKIFLNILWEARQQNLLFYWTNNEYRGSDDQVQRYWNMFRTKSSTEAVAAGFPDFFVYKI